MGWRNAGVACSWRGGGVGCGVWSCGARTRPQQLHAAWAEVGTHGEGSTVELFLSRVVPNGWPSSSSD